ncbi:hypothetical protein PYCC9005_002174 [Savitreella phatthalungensis]
MARKARDIRPTSNADLRLSRRSRDTDRDGASSDVEMDDSRQESDADPASLAALARFMPSFDVIDTSVKADSAKNASSEAEEDGNAFDFKLFSSAQPRSITTADLLDPPEQVLTLQSYEAAARPVSYYLQPPLSENPTRAAQIALSAVSGEAVMDNSRLPYFGCRSGRRVLHWRVDGNDGLGTVLRRDPRTGKDVVYTADGNIKRSSRWRPSKARRIKYKRDQAKRDLLQKQREASRAGMLRARAASGGRDSRNGRGQGHGRGREASRTRGGRGRPG